MSIKKTLKASEQNREDIKQKRDSWLQFQKNVDINRLIFLDETGAKTNMTRLYGRSKKGKRCNDSAPDGRWERTTILSALRLTGETYTIVFEGATDGEMYNAYVKNVLTPALKPGDVVVMDNLNVHKSEIARKLISDAGAECLFLPAYSPDLNPIEKMWSKIKSILRGMKARTSDTLYEAIKFALNEVNANDAKGWFASCGYT